MPNPPDPYVPVPNEELVFTGPTPLDRLKAAKKALVAVILPILTGLLVDLLTDAQTLIPGILTGLLTGGGVYQARNTPAIPRAVWRPRQ